MGGERDGKAKPCCNRSHKADDEKRKQMQKNRDMFPMTRKKAISKSRCGVPEYITVYFTCLYKKTTSYMLVEWISGFMKSN